MWLSSIEPTSVLGKDWTSLGICSCVSLGWSQDLAFFCEISPEYIRPDSARHVSMQDSEFRISDTKKWEQFIFHVGKGKWRQKKSTNRWQILSFGGVSRSGQHSLTRWFCGVTWLQFHHWASPRSCLAPKSGSLAFSKSLWTAPFLAN